MTILTAPVTADETTFVVSDATLLDEDGLPQTLQISSEKFAIVGYEAASNGNTRWYVERGVDGSIAASHSGGVAVTNVTAGGGGGVSVTDGTTTVAATSLQLPAGTVTDLGGGAAGVGLILRRLGPYRVNFNDASVTTIPGHLAASNVVPTGSVIIHAWPVPTTRCVAPNTTPRLIINIGTVGNTQQFFATDHGGLTVQSGSIRQGVDNEFVTNFLTETWTTFADCSIYVQMVDADGATSLDQGAVDVYAIIATPAS